jgi:Protein of unknown function (DUF2996)
MPEDTSLQPEAQTEVQPEAQTDPQAEAQVEVQAAPQAEAQVELSSTAEQKTPPKVPKAKTPKAESSEAEESESEAQPDGEQKASAKAAKAGKAAKMANGDGEDGPAPKAKAPKKEAVEDKPFGDFMAQDYLPALEKAFASKNVSDLKLSFDSKQVSGQWLNGQRQFTIYFPQGSINAQRAFSCTTGETAVSTIEPFLGDERKITLDLLVFGVIQRLNAQKWFGNN